MKKFGLISIILLLVVSLNAQKINMKLALGPVLGMDDYKTGFGYLYEVGYNTDNYNFILGFQDYRQRYTPFDNRLRVSPFYIGARYMLPLGDKVSVNGGFNAGLAHYDMSLYLDYDNSLQLYHSFAFENGWGLYWEICAELSYSVSEQFDLLMRYGYAESKANLDYLYRAYDNTTEYLKENDNVKIENSNFNIMMGVIFNF